MGCWSQLYNINSTIQCSVHKGHNHQVNQQQNFLCKAGVSNFKLSDHFSVLSLWKDTLHTHFSLMIQISTTAHPCNATPIYRSQSIKLPTKKKNNILSQSSYIVHSLTWVTSTDGWSNPRKFHKLWTFTDAMKSICEKRRAEKKDDFIFIKDSCSVIFYYSFQWHANEILSV